MRILRCISLIVAMAVILSVSAFAAPPVILSQPQNVFFPVGTTLPATANFSVLASGDNLQYQWQYKARPDLEWTNFSGSSYQSANASITVNQNNVNGVSQYRVVVSNEEGSVSSSVVSVSVGAYIMETIPQMLAWGTQIINSIFDWIGSACSCIIDTPLLLIGVSLFALGASIAILSRLLSRS